MNKTEKSKFLYKIEAQLVSVDPKEIDVANVDAMFLLHTLQNLPLTFGAVAKVLLSKLCDLAQQVHLVCDTYINPPIKEIEWDKQGVEETKFSITGAEQRRPKEWQLALMSASF